jgi:hypothetical protein
VEQRIKNEYDRLHREAIEDPQRAGHGGEATWKGILEQWLPPAYEIVTRKYIIPEVGTNKFETDIVVLHPSYPKPLRSESEILAGGVAAAFSVRLTLDADGIRDGVERAVALRRGLSIRYGLPRDEMGPLFPVGLLAHSHSWKAPGSTPVPNVAHNLRSLDNDLVRHPRESLDYLCVADLGLWWTVRIPYLPPSPNLGAVIATPQGVQGTAVTGISQTDINETSTALASFITHLLARLSYTDTTLRPLAESLRAMGMLGNATGETRAWDLGVVFSATLRNQLPTLMSLRGSDFWGSTAF